MNYTALERAIRAGDDPGYVVEQARALLRDVLAGRSALRAVRHPLGFFCFPAVREGDLGVCVHVWTSALPASATTTSTVHCHSWDLVSFVLYGSVTHTLLDVVRDPAGEDQVFEVISRYETDELRPLEGFVRCERRERTRTGPGSSYRLEAGQFHSSTNEGTTEAATVVLGRTRATADLTLAPRGTAGHRVRREVCSAAETATLARTAVRELEA